MRGQGREASPSFQNHGSSCLFSFQPHCLGLPSIAPDFNIYLYPLNCEYLLNLSLLKLNLISLNLSVKTLSQSPAQS